MHTNTSILLEHREFGNTTIAVADDEFFNGFQVGKFTFRTLPKEPLTDDALFTFVTSTLQAATTSRYQAGVMSGFFSSLYRYHVPLMPFHQPVVPIVGERQ